MRELMARGWALALALALATTAPAAERGATYTVRLDFVEYYSRSIVYCVSSGGFNGRYFFQNSPRAWVNFGSTLWPMRGLVTIVLGSGSTLNAA